MFCKDLGKDLILSGLIFSRWGIDKMICFAWDGFPQYAARCVGAFAASTDERVVVVATRPSVPIEGMERLCGCGIFWIAVNDTKPLKELLGEIPRIMVVSGWSISAFNAYSNEVRQNGGKVIAMIDHNFRFNLKEIIKSIRFRLLLRNKFDGFFVPGKSGQRLLRFYGVKDDKIVTGMYSADASLFDKGKPLYERDKRIIYVGQFIQRKNVRRMVVAFQKAASSCHDGWSLHLYGSGRLKDELERIADKRVFVHSFVQPEQLAVLYQDARVFCLPSIEEHWGLVVHEAALSGCVLLLSNAVGAAEDLLTDANGFSFDPHSDEDMVKAFRSVMEMSDDALSTAYESSIRIAETVSVEHFVNGIKKFL